MRTHWKGLEKINMRDLRKLRKDKNYIKELLKATSNDALRNYIANELCTYDHNARKYKSVYLLLTASSVGLPVISAALSGMGATPWILILLSCLTAISGAFNASLKPKELWIHYRKYAELSKREISEISIMKDDDPKKEEDLFKKLKEIFIEESSEWQKVRQKETKIQDPSKS